MSTKTEQKTFKNYKKTYQTTPNEPQIKITPLTLFSILKHYKNSSCCFFPEKKISGRIFGTFFENFIILTNSHAKNAENKFKSKKDIIKNDNFCVGIYVCGTFGISDQVVKYVADIEQEVGMACVVCIEPNESIKKGSLEMKGFVMKNGELKEDEIEIV